MSASLSGRLCWASWITVAGDGNLVGSWLDSGQGDVGDEVGEDSKCTNIAGIPKDGMCSSTGALLSKRKTSFNVFPETMYGRLIGGEKDTLATPPTSFPCFVLRAESIISQKTVTAKTGQP
ncbi:hypothetical protein BJ878DRAFT_557078 [Calycina marina]|uniref:Uncharacterized protein n=1 Tax=Calycina marina TaxID=1763456 RepID=A0A9P7Z8F8_9HELO|nr:hypothetical protein BJ878DRAFT_557078 [Calycina marina]